MTADKALNDPDGVLVTETQWVIIVATEEELDADHVIDGLVETFQFTINGLGISTCGFDNDLVVKEELHAVCQPGKLTTIISTEYGTLVSMVALEYYEGCDELE